MPGPVIYVAVAISAVAAVIVFKEVCLFCVPHATGLILWPLVRLRSSFPSKILRLEGLSSTQEGQISFAYCVPFVAIPF